MTKGGEFLIKEQESKNIFIPEEFTEEQKMMASATNEFVAYIQLGSLDPALFSDRTKVIVLYALCGFANFSSVGILISGIGSMAPERIPDLIQVSGKALIGATLASCLTGLVAGLFV